MNKVFSYDTNGFYLTQYWAPEGITFPQTTFTPVPNTPLTQGKNWRFVSGSWVQEDYFTVAERINYGTKITKLAFLNRLGDTVLGAIEAASRVNNSLGYAAAVIKIKHASSTYIDLSLDETKADVQKLVDYGFIDLDKKNEVLNTPVQEKEVPLFISNQII